MQTFVVIISAAALSAAQFVPPPDPVTLTTTMSGVLPVLPTGFTGVPTLEGAIIMKAPVNSSYVPVNGPAAVQSNLPAATYVATLPATAFNELTGTVISGTIIGSTAQGATGVTFTISLSNLPNQTQYGPFPYHIHNMPVPADGNCTSTLGHFDYTNAGEYYRCDTANPQNCQVGDLAGKHGMAMNLGNGSFSASYTDNYLSTDPSSPYFFGARSIVIHTSNTTRLTCANFVVQGATGTNSSQYPTTSPSGTSPPVTSYTGSANKITIGGALAGLIAFAAVLRL